MSEPNSAAWLDGYDANQDGWSELVNPYNPESPEWRDWNDGWNTAEEEDA